MEKVSIKDIENVISKKEHYYIRSMQGLDSVLKSNYSYKNDKKLSYFVNNLLYMKHKGTDQYIFKQQYYNQFMKISNEAERTVTIQDVDNKYLKGLDSQWASEQYASVKYIQHYAELEERTMFFLTLTPTSKYRFYKFINPENHKMGTKKNKNCEFNTLGQTLEQSFDFLNEIVKDFYNQVKRDLGREFNKVHKNTVWENEEEKQKIKDNFIQFPYVNITEQFKADRTNHKHLGVFLRPEQVKIFKEVFYRICKEVYKLEQIDWEEVSEAEAKKKGIKGANPVNYIMKYITKSMKTNNKFQDKDKKEDLDNSEAEYRRYFYTKRFITKSRYKHITKDQLNRVYSHLKNNDPFTFGLMLKSTQPLYVSLENYIIMNCDIATKEVIYNRPNKDLMTKYTKEAFEESFNNHFAWILRGSYSAEDTEEIRKSIKKDIVKTVFHRLKNLEYEIKEVKITKIASIWDRRLNKMIYMEDTTEKTPNRWSVDLKDYKKDKNTTLFNDVYNENDKVETITEEQIKKVDKQLVKLGKITDLEEQIKTLEATLKRLKNPTVISKYSKKIRTLTIKSINLKKY